MIKQYIEIGGLLGYDIEGNKEKVRNLLTSIGMGYVHQ